MRFAAETNYPSSRTPVVTEKPLQEGEKYKIHIEITVLVVIIIN